MKQLKKMSSFNIQVLEGVDPMSDANLAEINGGSEGCTFTLNICSCFLSTANYSPPTPINPKATALKLEVQSHLIIE